MRLIPHEKRYFSLVRLWHETLNGAPLHAFRGNFTQTDAMQKIRRKLRQYRDLRIAVRNQPSFNVGGGNWDIDFIIRGPELDRLAQYTQRLQTMVTEGTIPGIIDSDVSLKLDSPEVRVSIPHESVAGRRAGPLRRDHPGQSRSFAADPDDDAMPRGRHAADGPGFRSISVNIACLGGVRASGRSSGNHCCVRLPPLRRGDKR